MQIFLLVPKFIPEVTPDWVALVYYTPFIVIFQIGWASTQVSHLSVIPNLTPIERERTQLNSFRYGGTVLSSIAVYGIAFAFLQSSDSINLGWEDRYIFNRLAIIVICVGSVFSFVFHFFVPEETELGPLGIVANVNYDDEDIEENQNDHLIENEGTPLLTENGEEVILIT
jgi:Na+/melibiose symporter-like transporter